MSAVLSPADSTAGFAGAVTMEDEPAGLNLYVDGTCYSVSASAPTELADAYISVRAYMLGENRMQTGTEAAMRIPPKVAVQIAEEMWQAAKRLIAAQDAKEREGGKA